MYYVWVCVCEELLLNAYIINKDASSQKAKIIITVQIGIKNLI